MESWAAVAGQRFNGPEDTSGVPQTLSDLREKTKACRWQGMVGPFKKAEANKRSPAGKGVGLVARGNRLLSNQLPLCKLWAY